MAAQRLPFSGAAKCSVCTSLRVAAKMVMSPALWTLRLLQAAADPGVVRVQGEGGLVVGDGPLAVAEAVISQAPPGQGGARSRHLVGQVLKHDIEVLLRATILTELEQSIAAAHMGVDNLV